MWQALLGDLYENTPASVIAARFHKGLARAIVTMASKAVLDGETRAHAPRRSVGRCYAEPLACQELTHRLEARISTYFYRPKCLRTTAVFRSARRPWPRRVLGARIRVRNLCVLASPDRSSAIADVERKLAMVDVGGVKRRSEHRVHRRRPRNRCLCRRLGTGACRLRHEPDRRGAAAETLRDLDRTREPNRK